MSDSITLLQFRSRRNEAICAAKSSTRTGDTIIFTYAGHGAQIPSVGRDAEVGERSGHRARC